MQGRWWPTWKRAAREAPGQMTWLAGNCRPPQTCALVGSPARPLRTQPSIPLGRVGKDGVGRGGGLGDRTTPAADYRAQRSEERHMPLNLTALVLSPAP